MLSEDFVLDFFDQIRLISSALVFPIFDGSPKKESKNILICKGKEAYAEGEYNEEGLTVFKNSKANLLLAPSSNPSLKTWRQKLIDKNLLKKSGDHYVFTEDHLFPSPSAAAKIVLARSANGWVEWKDKNGKTLDEKIRK